MNIRTILIATAWAAMLWAVSPAEAKVVTQTVPYTHQGTVLKGYLAYDDAAEGKRPGILVVHEWWGLNDYARRRAEQLAGLGYVAFALDMYGQGKSTRHPQEAGKWSKQIKSNVSLWRQRALAGLEVLRKDPRTDPARTAAIGYCFGGATVQVMAYDGAPLKGVVSFHGSLVPPAADQAGWTQTRILICHGAADPFTKKGAVENYMTAMEKSGLDWQLNVYGGAKHSFTNPNADQAGIKALGYDKAADQRSWAAMKRFFDELFGAS